MTAIYNVFGNLFKGIWNKLVQHKLKFLTLFILTIVGLYMSRAFWYQDVNYIRQHTPEIVTILMAITAFFILISISVKSSSKGIKGLTGFFAFAQILIIAGTVFVLVSMKDTETNPFNILNKSAAVNNLVVKDLEYLPLTDKERIYPYETILKIARDKITSSDYTVEHFEMVYDNQKEDLVWNAEKSPSGNINKLARNVQGVVTLNATSDQILKNEENVEFNYGRKLKWFNSLNYILPKMLNPLDYFDKTIDDNVRLIKDSNGEWIQVVGVTDWEGIWPSVYPKFAGVFVVKQKSDKYDEVTIMNTDFFVPTGDNPEIKFYTPEEIKGIEYLKNQNLVPSEITRFYAKAWTFKNGIGNFFIKKKGLTKITKISEERNQQPFTVYFNDVKTKAENPQKGLYQFYALEPRGANTALSDILLFDPRGTSSDIIVYNYNTHKNKLNLLGPERIAKTIKDSDKHLDWSNFIIAESRPFIREIDGVRKFYFFNSIIAKEAASAKPTIAIADPDKLDVFWYRGNSIVKELEKDFSQINNQPVVEKKLEKNTVNFIDENKVKDFVDNTTKTVKSISDTVVEKTTDVVKEVTDSVNQNETVQKAKDLINEGSKSAAEEIEELKKAIAQKEELERLKSRLKELENKE